MASTTSRRSRWRRPALATGVAVVVLGAGYATAATATASTVPRGTTVAGVGLGGLGRDAAEAALAEGLADLGARPVPVVAERATDELDPAASGLTLDVPATVDRALGSAWSPVSLWRRATGGEAVEPVTRVDPDALTAALTELGDRVARPAVDGGIDFAGGRATAVAPEDGLVLDVPAAADVVGAQWLGGQRPLSLPVEVQEPDVDAAAVQLALERFGQPAVSGPLTVVVGSARVELPVAAVAPLLGTAVEQGELVGRVDGAGLVAAVLDADPDAVTQPRDARVEVTGGAPTVVPAVTGTSIDADALAGSAVEALARAGERTATARLTDADPELTTAEAQGLGVVERIAEFSSPLTPDAPRTENITIAADVVDGTLLLPGETFSLNGVLGQRTPEKGYKQAGVISGGKLTKDYGGGVSQLATTLFNGMFFAGLRDVEHKAHSLYFSRYPEGREATVAWPSVDLEFTNDAETGVLIETWVADGQVHTTFWGTKVHDVEATRSARRNVRVPDERVEVGDDCVPQQPITGFDVTVTRVFRSGGEVVRSEDFDTRYNALDAVRCEEAAEPVDPQAVVPDAPAPVTEPIG